MYYGSMSFCVGRSVVQAMLDSPTTLRIYPLTGYPTRPYILTVPRGQGKAFADDRSDRNRYARMLNPVGSGVLDLSLVIPVTRRWTAREHLRRRTMGCSPVGRQRDLQRADMPRRLQYPGLPTGNPIVPIKDIGERVEEDEPSKRRPDRRERAPLDTGTIGLYCIAISRW
jgi:hypothetical protein